MAILSTAKCLETCAEAQAQRRMQQLHVAAEQMRQAADAAQLQFGEASHEYHIALDQWNTALQYFEQFINELLSASGRQESHGSKNDANHKSLVHTNSPPG
eukprot:COSAG02_NODE_3082_length_7406_cov_5.254379_1_plen_101_part_00